MNTCAREALCAVVVLWLVAIAFATVEYVRARKSFSAVIPYRPGLLVSVTLLLPVAGFVGAFILGLYVHRG
jgi:hypothetical protein